MTEVRTTSNRIPPDQRRGEILDCATDLFARRGFDLTTMDDIADAAGITKRTLYRYVKSKDELLYDIHDLFSGVHLIPQGDGLYDDPVEELRNIIRAHIRVVVKNRTAITVFFEERKHLTGARWRLIEQRRDAYESHTVKVIEDGIKRGLFRDFNPRPVAQAILGGLTEFYRWMQLDGSLTVDELAEEHIRLIIEGAATNRSVELQAPQVPLIDSGGRRKAATGRDRVRAAAIASFARSGYHATSVRDLAEAADTTKGAVMYHAGYKHDLLEEIIRTTFERGIEVLESAAAAATGGPLNTLYQLITAHMDFMAEHRDAIAVTNENIRYLEPDAFTRIEVLRRRWNQQFRTVIEKGLADGELGQLDPGRFTLTLVGVLNSAARWYNPLGGLRPEGIGEIYARLFLLGLLKP